LQIAIEFAQKVEISDDFPNNKWRTLVSIHNSFTLSDIISAWIRLASHSFWMNTAMADSPVKCYRLVYNHQLIVGLRFMFEETRSARSHLSYLIESIAERMAVRLESHALYTRFTSVYNWFKIHCFVALL